MHRSDRRRARQGDEAVAGVTPELTGAALEAIRHRGGHLQIIAAAGSGKTEVVSQRVVDLLADELPPEAIVAFTFTERAADELSSGSRGGLRSDSGTRRLTG